jgi:hypothetical protein
MNEDLLDQLGRYRPHFEAGQSEIRLEEVRSALTGARPGVARRRQWLVVAAVPLVLLIAVGGAALIFGWYDPAPDPGPVAPATSTVTTPDTSATTPEPTASTVASTSTSSALEPDPDPAPGWMRYVDPEVFGDASIAEVLLLGDRLVAVGTTHTSCRTYVAGTSTCYFGAWISDDFGVTWRAVHEGDVGMPARVRDGIVVGSGIVVVGFDPLGVRDGTFSENGVVWTSPDGESWTRLDDPVFIESRITGVAAGPNGLVAVGRAWIDDGVGYPPAVWTSPDGATWTRVPHDEDVFAGNTCCTRVTLHGETYVAAASVLNGLWVWISVDGTTWEGKRIGPGDWVHDIVASDIGIVLTTGPQIWFSPDGETWTSTAELPPLEGAPPCLGQWVGHIAPVENGFAAVGARCDSGSGSSQAGMWVSADGIAWTLVSDATDRFSGSMKSAQPIPGGFLVFGNDPAYSEGTLPANTVVWIWEPETMP